MKRTLTRTAPLVSAAGLMLAAATARGGLLLYEGFDYAPGVDALVGQSGGQGWDGSAWGEGGSATGGDREAGVVAASSLVFSDFAATGHVAKVRNNHNSNNTAGPTTGNWIAHRQLPDLGLAAGQDLFISFLYRQNQPRSVANFGTVTVVRNSDTATGGGSNTGFQFEPIDQFGSNNPDEVGFGYDASRITSASAVLNNETDYLFIGKFENVGGAGDQVGTMWVLSEADWDAVKGGGVTEAELNANNRAVLTETVTGVGFNAGDYLQLLAGTQFGDPNESLFDEYKVFTELNDIFLTEVPEPASLLLIAGGSLLWLGRPRRD